MEFVELFERADTYDLLRQYANEKDVFVHLSKVMKVGIHPSTTFKTPIGVYAYPLAYVLALKSISNLPFAAQHPYIFILKSRGLA